MANKKLSEKTYKILETEGAHTVASKDTRGATRGLEFEDGTNKLIGPAELVEVETRPTKRYEEFSVGEQLIIDAAEIIVTNITEYLTEKAISSFDNWFEESKSTKEEAIYKKRAFIKSKNKS